ncbi:MAG TPA: hypothetical protein PLW86_13155, partial [Rhodocyclaceae bacterium]|nr:hypothetical protein [Rhodocyclaceae bacterium]
MDLVMQQSQLKIFAIVILCVASSHANSTDQAQQLFKDQEYCYALGAMANMTVLNKNGGKSFEEQMASRKKSLGENSPEYRLV